jgi:hypothetical protein
MYLPGVPEDRVDPTPPHPPEPPKFRVHARIYNVPGSQSKLNRFDLLYKSGASHRTWYTQVWEKFTEEHHPPSDE